MRAIPILITIVSFWACHAKQKTPPAATSDSYYTCSMHPQVMQEQPGKCPICGMELIAVKKQKGQEKGFVVLSDQQMQLGNIRMDTVRNGSIGDKMLLTGTVNIDETKTNVLSTRIAGRMDKLYFKNTGEYLKKGDKIYDLYSEELNNAEQEYLLALERAQTLSNGVIDLHKLVEDARNKLLLWSISNAQLSDLARSKKASPLTSFYSPSSAYIVAIEGHEGDYLAEGTTIFRLADLSSLWVEAQVYSSQLSNLDKNGTAVIGFPDLPGQHLTGRILFVNPEIDPNVRVNLIRIPVSNPGGLLKPGMPAYVTLTNHETHSLTLPARAVIRNAKTNVVWVQTEHNTFKPVYVDIGEENDDRVEIKAGLQTGDVIVTEGAYLINSEFIFKHGETDMSAMN